MDEHQSNGQETIVQPTENIVEIDGGNMFTTSLIVAQAFEKNHFDVLKAIKNLECSPQFRECPAYILLYQFSPKDTGQSKVK